MDERLARVTAALREAKADWAILTNADSVCYATGHVVPVETGASPFAGGPTTAFVSRDGVCGVVSANVEGASAAASWAQTVHYEGFAFDHAVDPIRNYLETAEAFARQLGVGGTLAIEAESHPSALKLAGSGGTVEFGPFLKRVRATKTDEEKPLMQRAAEAAAVGQKTFLEALHAGRNELEIFADIRCSIEKFAGERVALTGDFLSGPARTAGFTGWPIDRTVASGDPVICDLAPRVAGYWGDSCSSTSVERASDDYLKLFRAARGALEHAIDIMRPGLVVADLDAELRRIVGQAGYSYPHHSGHSLGTSVHEWPRLVPYETCPLEAGMFLMVEPGAYDPSVGGVRTEWMIEITADGCRPVAPFDFMASN